MSFTFETVSVEQAIQKGRKDVVLPSILIFIVSIAVGFTGFIVFSLILYFPLVMIAGPVMALLYYSKKSAKWRIWAFENVRNAHELKERARNSGLMKEDGSPVFFDIGVSEADKEKWKSLQEKFNRPDVFNDDLQVPPETVVYYSKTKKYLTLLFYVPILGVGVLIMFIPDVGTYVRIWGAFLMVVGIGLFYITIRDAYNGKPQITISNEGMSNAETPFYPWSQIRDERTTMSTSGRIRSIYLNYYFPGGLCRFTLDGFTLNRSKIDHLLRVYRGRANQKAKRPSHQ